MRKTCGNPVRMQISAICAAPVNIYYGWRARTGRGRTWKRFSQHAGHNQIPTLKRTACIGMQRVSSDTVGRPSPLPKQPCFYHRENILPSRRGGIVFKPGSCEKKDRIIQEKNPLTTKDGEKPWCDETRQSVNDCVPKDDVLIWKTNAEYWHSHTHTHTHTHTHLQFYS